MEGDGRQIASTAEDSANSRTFCVLWRFVSEMVGATGFEPATPCAQGRCATRLRYAPILKPLDFTSFSNGTLIALVRFRGETCRRTVPELSRLSQNGSLIGRAIQLLQRLAFHLQLHLRVLLEHL